MISLQEEKQNAYATAEWCYWESEWSFEFRESEIICNIITWNVESMLCSSYDDNDGSISGRVSVQVNEQMQQLDRISVFFIIRITKSRFAWLQMQNDLGKDGTTTSK